MSNTKRFSLKSSKSPQRRSCPREWPYLCKRLNDLWIIRIAADEFSVHLIQLNHRRIVAALVSLQRLEVAWNTESITIDLLLPFLSKTHNSCLQLWAGIWCVYKGGSNMENLRVSSWTTNALMPDMKFTLAFSQPSFLFFFFFLSFCLGRRNSFWLSDLRACLNILELLKRRAFKKSPLSKTTLRKRIKASKFYKWITSILHVSVSWLFYIILRLMDTSGCLRSSKSIEEFMVCFRKLAGSEVKHMHSIYRVCTICC